MIYNHPLTEIPCLLHSGRHSIAHRLQSLDLVLKLLRSTDRQWNLQRLHVPLHHIQSLLVLVQLRRQLPLGLQLAIDQDLCEVGGN